MRITEKIVKMILQIEIYNNIDQQNSWIAIIEKFIDISIYGKEVGKMGHQKILIAIDKNDVITNMSFKGNSAEKNLQYASKLIYFCLKDNEMNKVQKNIISKYILLITIINRKENLTEKN